ncbi:MAG: alpha/beta hydrolase [Ilumatobacter sp.]|uniref:alpha/beta fold hydrolase n=1 Tax=Ilumatobacter sp. TaxID=1967498 RepID=UPI00261D5C7B|nr:alpha/beta hydrolase [Ilumatobacter sp.]MDJ0769009.1 alpha/beta hydrolase [Ilumatobacter sp.]
MIAEVDGVEAHASTGGVELDGDDPVVLLIHGAGMDSTVWQLQTRYLAHRGFRAVAVDLPAHGRSGGDALDSIEAMADWVARFVEVAGFGQVHLAGHSMGTFIALELASRYPDAVDSVTLCGTATGMPVHPELLDAAEHDLPRAAALMAAWAHAKPAHVGLNPTPGLWMLGGARALVERSKPGVLSTDFAACMAYENAEVAAKSVSCPATVVIGLGDKMTPAKSGRALAAALPSATVVELPATGHTMMIENPRAVKRAILDAVSA